MRYLATIGFCLTAFVSLFLLDNNTFPGVPWAMVLIMNPFFWFWVVGSRKQWRRGEVLIFFVVGLIGEICFRLWDQEGALDYTPFGGTTDFYLFAFWGSAAVAVMKLGGFLLEKVHPSPENGENHASHREKPANSRQIVFACFGYLLLAYAWSLVWIQAIAN